MNDTMGTTNNFNYDFNGFESMEDKKVKDNFTGKEVLSSKLTKVKSFSGRYIYTSKPVKVVTVSSGGIIYTCQKELDRKDKIFYNHPTEKILIEKGAKYVNSTKKPEKIYNLRNYHHKFPSNLKKKVNNFHEFLYNYTFGFEIETSAGTLPVELSHELNFANIYDGSITGTEYVSVPFRPDNLHYLEDMLELLDLCTEANPYCSFHIHIGGVPYSEDNMLLLYTLFQRLQEELNMLIPPYKKDPKFLVSKDKDHCKNLPKLVKSDVNEIYKLFFKTTNVKSLKDSNYVEANNKWTIGSRYYAVNFTNFILLPSGKNTIEIRSLQSTYSINLIYTWLLINTNIIHYALNNKKAVFDNKIKITLEDILINNIKNKKLLNDLLENINLLKTFYFNMNHINGDVGIDSYNNVENFCKTNLKPIKENE